MELPPATVLFDGVCAFCDRQVQWLIRKDVEGRLHFAPLQGQTAAAVRASAPGSVIEELGAVVFAESDGETVRLSQRSDAVLRILEVSGAAPRALGLLRLVPRTLRELGYGVIARMRYRVWGTLDACPAPTPEQRARFLS